MVRVLLFHYFKSQRTFSDSLQPTSFASTKDYLFLGTREMKVFVYSLEQPNFPLFCEFPIMSKPVKLICNEKAKCVLTIERTNRRKNAGNKVVSVQTHSRAYFNWFKANPDEAVRTYAAGHSHYQRQESEGKCKDFLALEIPTQFDVTAICCCPTSGNVAIASVKKVSLFRWSGNLTSGGTDVTAMYHDMEHFLDIEPSMIVKEVVLSDCYLAVRSNLDVQVLKLVFTADQDSVSSSRSGKSSSPGTTLLNKYSIAKSC